MPRDRATEDAQDLFTRGHKALDAGDFREAIECFSRAIRLSPDVSAGYRYRAYAYLELGDRVRALNDLDQAIRLKPDNVQGYADRAAELYLQRQYDQAIADCDRALKLDPARVSLIALRARCHADSGNSVAAFTDFAAAITADSAGAPAIPALAGAALPRPGRLHWCVKRCDGSSYGRTEESGGTVPSREHPATNA